MKIAICGLLTSENLGEWLIADGLCYLIKKVSSEGGQELNDADFVFVDINANKENVIPSNGAIDRRIKNCCYYKKYGIPGEILDVLLRKSAGKITSKKFRNTIYKFRHSLWRKSINLGKRYGKYYHEKFSDVDLIVVDGAGLLEYSTNEYQEPLLLISEYGEKNNIPVIYNAIGSSGEYDSEDYRCKVLMKALRSSAVKYISARDNLEAVKNCAGDNHDVKLLADAAFYTKEAYAIGDFIGEDKTADKEKIKKIGIGLIRGNALLRYNINFNEEDWIQLFISVGCELKNRGYDFFYFTNGMPADYELGKKVISRGGFTPDKLIDRPTKAIDLLKTIKKCDGLITCRMHSSIASMTLKIPSVVFSWNKKVDRYMNEIGYSERAISVDYFNAKYAVNLLEKALLEGISDENLLRMKNKAYESVLGYKDYLIKMEK